MDIRSAVQRRLDELEWTTYRLTQELKGRVPQAPLYSWLRGDSAINSHHLGHVLDALGLTITIAKKGR